MNATKDRELDAASDARILHTHSNTRHKDGTITCWGQLPRPEPTAEETRELNRRRRRMALLVQKVYRGHCGRRLSGAQRRRLAVLAVQRVWRGHKARACARNQCRVLAPALAPVSKGSGDAATLTMSCKTPGAAIYYTWAVVGAGKGSHGGCASGEAASLCEPVVESASLGTRGILYAGPVALWGQAGLISLEEARVGGLQISARAFHVPAGMGASPVVCSGLFTNEAPRKIEKAESKRIGGGFKATTGVSKELLKAMGARSARAVEADESVGGARNSKEGGIARVVAAKSAASKLAGHSRRASSTSSSSAGAAAAGPGGGGAGGTGGARSLGASGKVLVHASSSTSSRNTAPSPGSQRSNSSSSSCRLATKEASSACGSGAGSVKGLAPAPHARTGSSAGKGASGGVAGRAGVRGSKTAGAGAGVGGSGSTAGKTAVKGGGGGGGGGAATAAGVAGKSSVRDEKEVEAA